MGHNRLRLSKNCAVTCYRSETVFIVSYITKLLLPLESFGFITTKVVYLRERFVGKVCEILCCYLSYFLEFNNGMDGKAFK